MNGNLISNTGPIIALSVVDHLEILHELFKSVSIPEAVHKEILDGGDNDAGIESYSQASWIQVIPLPISTDPLLTMTLDSGESSVIQLAVHKNADVVLIDERKARKIARSIYNLNVVGTARILVEAKHYGLIENVGKVLMDMRSNGYWIHEQIVNVALKQAGENS